MLAACLLACSLRGARQRLLDFRGAAVIGTAWRLMQPVEPRLPAGGFDGIQNLSSGSFGSTGNCFFSSSTLDRSGVGSSGTSPGSETLKPRDARGRFISHTAEPQPQLQAWLQQQQGLSAKEADQHARRLALIFGSQQAAREGLPATFSWCRGERLTSLQTVRLLDRVARVRRENVVQFAALMQPVWQLMDSYIAAWAEQQQRVGDSRLRKHSSLAEVLCSNSEAAKALCMPPGHLEAWLAAVSEQMSAAAIGQLLLSQPNVVCGSPSTAVAAIGWATNVLGATDPAAFFAKAPGLLQLNAAALQRNLDNMQHAVGARQARQLVLKQPKLLTASLDTVQAALAWLRQLFPDAEQLAGILDRGALMLNAPVRRLQGNADYLGRALGWQGGDGQLAAFIAARPSDFANINLDAEDMQHKLLLLSQAVGVSMEECLCSGIGYLNRRLDNIAARYVLVQARAPELLYSRNGNPGLSWIIDANKPHNLRRLGMTREEFNSFVRGWPASEEGRLLLEGLRAGSVEGWPRPMLPQEAAQLQAAEAE